MDPSFLWDFFEAYNEGKVAPLREHLFLFQPVRDHLKPSSRFGVLWTTQSCNFTRGMVYFWFTLVLRCVDFGVLLIEVELDTLATQPLISFSHSLYCCEKESWKFQNRQMTLGQRWFLCLFISLGSWFHFNFVQVFPCCLVSFCLLLRLKYSIHLFKSFLGGGLDQITLACS